MKKVFTLLTLLLCVCSGAWADSQTIKAGSSANDAAFSYTSLSEYTYSSLGYWASGDNDCIAIAKGGSFTFTNSSGATITGITVKGVAQNNSDKNSTITITDNATTPHSITAARTGDNKWAGQKTADNGHTSVVISSEDIANLQMTAGTVYTVSNGNTNSDYQLAIIIEITYTPSGKTTSTFALTSSVEPEVAIDATSQITYENNAGTVTYSSADESIATVSSTGLITGVASGKTTITVTDPGSVSVAGAAKTVSVIVPYPNPSAAESYVLNQDTYAFANSDNTKHYFTNGFTMTPSYSGELQNGGLTKSLKYSNARSYTIQTPSNVTITYAVITARSNYGDNKTAATWGTVFGTDYSATALPYSNEDPAEKDFVVGSPSAGADLAFQPGGNQWQAIIKLYTITHGEKRTVSFYKGDGTGTMDDQTHRGYTTFTLPASTFTPPTEKGFDGWLCDIDGLVYQAGEEYTMTDANTTFTAQYGSVEGKTIIRVTLGGGTNATVSGAIGGTANVSVQSDKKFGSNSYAGFTLAGSNTIKKGDIINVRITTASSGGSTYINFYDTSSGENILQGTGTAGVVGDNKFVAGDNLDGKQTIYVCRTSTNGWNAYVDYIEVIRPVSVTIGTTGWSTFSSSYALDFEHATKANDASADLEAYMVTGAAGTAITKSEAVTNVPGNTGLLLNGTASAVYYIPVLASSATSTAGNLMKACVTATTVNYNDNSSLNYVLVNNSGIPEFQKIVSGTYSSATIPAGKAYLALTSDPGARALTLFDDMTTGINAVNGEGLNVQGAEVYNLAGQRVLNPTKGLYIVNGKKVVVK